MSLPPATSNTRTHDDQVGPARASRNRAMAVVAVSTTLLLPGIAVADSYQVQPGDTLWNIAVEHGVSVNDLAGANGLADPDRIQPGQLIRVPAPAGPTEHEVAPGQTLWDIANDYSLSVQALAEANGLADPHLIVEGSVLVIPVADEPAALADQPVAIDGRGLPAELRSHQERMALIPVFEFWADTYVVSEDLLMALTWWESGWNNSKVSSAGAIGIGQLLPITADFVGERLIGQQLDPNITEHNIQLSARYLRYLLDNTGSEDLAIAAYYQGLSAVRQHGVFDVSKGYVAGVQALRARFG